MLLFIYKTGVSSIKIEEIVVDEQAKYYILYGVDYMN